MLIKNLIASIDFPSFFWNKGAVLRDSPLIDREYTPLISGLFDSALNVGKSNFAENFLKVLISYYGKKHDPVIELLGDNAPKGLGILIQQQVNPDISGILHSQCSIDLDYMKISFTKGHLSKIVEGLESGGLIRIPIDSNIYDFPCFIADDNVFREARTCGLTNYVSGIGALGRLCERALGVKVEVEWAIEGNILWLLQAQPLNVR
jgi:hypothetical protein